MPRVRRSSGRWKSGWPSSTNGSSRWTHAPVSSPAAGDVRAGWPESCRSRHAPSGRAKPPARRPADHPLPISSGAAADVDAVAEVVHVAEVAIDLPRVRRRNRHRARHDLSAARLGGNGEIPHAGHPPQGGRAMPRGVTHNPGPQARGGREIRRGGRRRETPAIPTGDGGGAAVVEDEARDRTVPRRVAARRVAVRRRAEQPRSPEFAGIEWTSGALA